MSVTGNIKTNKLTLQGHGALNSSNVVLEVADSTFSISMGAEKLITLSPSGLDDLIDSSVDTTSLLTINRNTIVAGSLGVSGNTTVSGTLGVSSNTTVSGALRVTGNTTVSGALTIGSNIVLNGGIDQSLKTALSNIINSNAWQPSFGSNIMSLTGTAGVAKSCITLPYTTNVFTPLIGVHLYNNGESWQYQKGISSSSPANSNILVDENTTYYYASMSKTVTALMYARLKTLKAIPPGVSAKMVDFFPSMSNYTYWVPSLVATSNANTIGANTDAGTSGLYPWVNCVQSTRDLYVDDVFSESVGFHCGFDAATVLNPVTPFTAPVTYQQAAQYFYSAGELTTYYPEADQTKLNAPYNFVWAYGYANDMLYGTAYNGAATNPDLNFEAWLSKYNSKGRILLMYEHGNLNYNSSENFSTALITRAYQNFYPSAASMSCFEIFKKELLDPTGSQMVTSFTGSTDPKYVKMASVWKDYNSAGWVPDSLYDLRNPGFSLYNAAYVDPVAPLGGLTLSYVHRNMYGNNGFIGTLQDLSKVLQVISRKGILSNGKRLINAMEIANMMVPRIKTSEHSGLGLQAVYNNDFETFSLGGSANGPNYANADTIDPTRAYLKPAQGILTSKKMGSSINYAAPSSVFSWGGATGCIFSAGIEKENVFVMSLMECNSGMGSYAVLNPISNLLNNVLNSGANSTTEIYIP